MVVQDQHWLWEIIHQNLKIDHLLFILFIVQFQLFQLAKDAVDVTIHQIRHVCYTQAHENLNNYLYYNLSSGQPHRLRVEYQKLDKPSGIQYEVPDAIDNQ